MNRSNYYKKNSKKYLFITGGVASSLGKGLAAASIASLLERRGIKINMLKMDPYINVDPGTMNPIQHGEVYVTEDGAETDLDLGHYERFTSLTLTKDSNFTSGQVYLQVIENERQGEYLGKTVQVIPHITDEIKRRITIASEGVDLLIGEIGGTVGDIESLPFLEAIRQFANDVNQENVLFIHLVLLPYIAAAKELKSKPAQHSVKELRSIGLFPNIIICRSDREIKSSITEKISVFCNVPKDHVFESQDVDTIYKVPFEFYKQGLDEKITSLLGMWTAAPKIVDLQRFIFNFNHPLKNVRIGIVGKYTKLVESYKSLDEAIHHASIHNRTHVISVYIDAESIENNDQDAWEKLKGVDGLLVPGGFGVRGIEGKIKTIEYARKHKKPYLGICLGMQLAIIEFARNIVGLKEATSEEFSKHGDFVVHYMKDQKKNRGRGGSMRLGSYPCTLSKRTRAFEIYGRQNIKERHRHRLEVNDDYMEELKEKGLVCSGFNEDFNLIEIIELQDHPFFIACQFHPEFKSRPFAPHPLFDAFLTTSGGSDGKDLS